MCQSIVSTKFPIIVLFFTSILLETLVFAKPDEGNGTVMLDMLSLPQGVLKGQMQMSRGRRIYYSFMSIPYARPPQMKFEPAQPGENWKGVLNATKPAPPCPQTSSRVKSGSFEVLGQEDCLYLSVHTPKDAIGRRRQMKNSMDLLYPVIFFLHDGMFTWGNGDEFGAKYFLDEDILLVTANFRLGALGFLTTGDGEIPANIGLKDQVLALQWVQSNIEYFGGDPRRVTLFGAGSGAVSAQLHTLSPMSSGLFSHVIASSGSALVPWAISKNPALTAKSFGLKLGCNSTKNSRDLSFCLKAKDFKDIVRAQSTFLDWANDPLVPFSPTVEFDQRSSSPIMATNGLGHFGNNRPSSYFQQEDQNFGKKDSIFLTDYPYRLILDGRFHRVPQLAGFQQNETLFGSHADAILATKKFASDMNQEWTRVAPITLLYENVTITPMTVQNPFSRDGRDEVSHKIRNFYFGNKAIGSETRENLTNLYVDRYVVHGVEMAAAIFARYSNVYMFQLSFIPTGKLFTSRAGGVRDTPAHGLQYFFDIKNMGLSANSAEENFSKKLIKLWTNFASSLYGQPTHTMMSSTEWLPIRSTAPPAAAASENDDGRSSSITGHNFYDLGGDDFRPLSESMVLANRMNFWTHLLANELSQELNFEILQNTPNQNNVLNYYQQQQQYHQHYPHSHPPPPPQQQQVPYYPPFTHQYYW